MHKIKKMGTFLSGLKSAKRILPFLDSSPSIVYLNVIIHNSPCSCLYCSQHIDKHDIFHGKWEYIFIFLER